MTRWTWTRCPRCGGNMFRYPDLDSCYESCLQCGYCRELNGVTVGPDGKPAQTYKQRTLREQHEFQTSPQD